MMNPLSPQCVWMHKSTWVEILRTETLNSNKHWTGQILKGSMVAVQFSCFFILQTFLVECYSSNFSLILFSLADALWKIALKRGSRKPIELLSHISMLSTNCNPQLSSTLSPPLYPLFQQAPGPAVALCLCRWGYIAAVPLTYRTNPLFPCSSTLSLLLPQSITWQLMFQHMFLSLLRFIVFHTGLCRPNRLTPTVMKLPHIEQVRGNNI